MSLIVYKLPIRCLKSLACILLMAGCTYPGRTLPLAQSTSLSNQALIYVSLFNGRSALEVYAPPRLRPVASLGPPNAMFGTSDIAGNIYVLSTGTARYPDGAVLVYPAGATKPARTITNVDAPVAAAVGSGRTLYLGNACNPSSSYCDFGNNGPTGSTSIFAPNATSPSVTYFSEQPSSFALGAKESLFVLNVDDSVIGQYAWVDYFTQSAKKRKTFALNDPFNPKPLSSFVVDGSGETIYAAYTQGSGYVDAYDRLSKKPRKITSGILDPTNLAVSSSHELFVANANSVSVYAPGASTPKRVIANGIDSPHILLFTRSSQLDVLNASSLTAFGANSAKLLYDVPTGYVQSAAIDASGNLYAISETGPAYAFVLTEYAASSGQRIWSTPLVGANALSSVSVGI